MKAPGLKRVRQFSPSAPQALARELNDFETNVASAFVQLGTTFPLHLRLRSVETATCSVLPWDMLPVDPSGGDMVVRLPAPAAALTGAYLVLLRRSSSNAVRITPTSGTVNGGTSSIFLSTAKRAYPYFCDGAGWWGA